MNEAPKNEAPKINDKAKGEKKEKGSKKWLILLLLLLLIGSVGYNYYSQQRNDATVNVLTDEKNELMKELEALKKQYDEEILNNKSVAAELEAERDKVLKLMDKLRKSDAQMGKLRTFRKEAQDLKLNMSHLITENRMLKALNGQLRNKVDSTFVVLNQAEVKANTLTKKVKTMATSIERGSVVQPLNLTFKGVGKRVQSKTKRESYTNRAKKTRELKVCFNLPENPLAEKGEIKFYIQITDPKNNIMGQKKTIFFDDKSLTYSFDKVIHYNNEAQEVCGYINTAFVDLPKGSYVVQLFRDDEFLLTEKLALF